MISDPNRQDGGRDESALTWEEGVLVSDTEMTLRSPGMRNGEEVERRLIFEGDRVCSELSLPIDAGDREEGAWLYGQFIVPDELSDRYDLPMYAVLQNESGVTGAIQMTQAGEFALPFRGHGTHVLKFEPREGEGGRGFRMTFTT